MEQFNTYLAQEDEHAQKNEPGWYVGHRKSFTKEIDNLVWKNYTKIGEGRFYPVARLSDRFVNQIKKHQDYLDSLGLAWDMLYHSEVVSVIRSGEFIAALPSEVLDCAEYASMDDYTVEELRNRIIGGKNFSIVKKGSVTRRQMTDRVNDKKDEIESKKAEIKRLEDEKRAEMERIRQEIEQKYQEKLSSIEKMKSEMEKQMADLEAQVFFLDTEIYSIRCLMGETVRFIPLLHGKHCAETEPVVFYQKLRYLDEELGKWLSIYGLDGHSFTYFEEALKVREDLREIFAPGPKSVSLIKVSKNNTIYCENEMVSNTLKQYEVYHGKTVGILLRDGENLWIGWTDENRISLYDGNAFLKPGNRIDKIEDVSILPTSREETISRYFIFSILQGVMNSKNLIRVPEGTNILKPNPFIIFSMADGWLEDNRFGDFADIVDRTDASLMKGDMIITTIRITRDDYRDYWSGKDTRYEAWNNGGRGRGEKNRTHDAVIHDRQIVRVNCIDVWQTYTVFYKKYKLDVKEIVDRQYTENGIMHTRSYIETSKTDEYMGDYTDTIEVINNKLFGKYGNTKGLDPEGVYKYAKESGYFGNDCDEFITAANNHRNSYYIVYDHTDLTDTDTRCYISVRKSDSNYWGDKRDSFANMEIRHNEYLNLTFLNSEYLTYAIRNRKIGGWRRGNMHVDYADSIPYLNTALQYIRKREEEEAAMLRKYMELYDGWQVDLSEWRLNNNYHHLTETRAKKFAREYSVMHFI